MSEYRRFVAYFYEYIDGKKQKNAGFAKVELRDGMWRILFRLTIPAELQPPARVYGFVREDGYLPGFLLGTMNGTRSDQQGMPPQEWAWSADTPIGFDKYCFGQMNGICIQSSEGRIFATVWDDEAFDPNRFVLEMPIRELETGQSEEADTEPERLPKPEAEPCVEPPAEPPVGLPGTAVNTPVKTVSRPEENPGIQPAEQPERETEPPMEPVSQPEENPGIQPAELPKPEIELPVEPAGQPPELPEPGITPSGEPAERQQEMPVQQPDEIIQPDSAEIPLSMSLFMTSKRPRTVSGLEAPARESGVGQPLPTPARESGIGQPSPTSAKGSVTG